MCRPSTSLSLKVFLTIEECPDDWQIYDIYIIRDRPEPGTDAVFYIGQSDCAFRRVWRHLQDGLKGRSLVGKFVCVNWPRSMHFVVDLHDSGYRESIDPASRRNDAERRLIETHHPCFNDTWNEAPTSLPSAYEPPTSSVRCPRHLKRMVREAGAAIERERRNSLQDSEW